MRIDVITLFPEILRGPLDASIMGRAQRGGQAEIVLHQLRDYATDKHRTVDEKPYGGGPGMLLKCEPIFAAVQDVQAKAPKPGRVILLSPGGARFDRPRRANLPRWIVLSLFAATTKAWMSACASIWSKRKSASAISF
jgi:tRNA (guanine37-N1)-methyltransferase